MKFIVLAEMSLGQLVYMTGEGGGLNKGANKGRSFRNSERVLLLNAGDLGVKEQLKSFSLSRFLRTSKGSTLLSPHCAGEFYHHCQMFGCEFTNYRRLFSQTLPAFLIKH